MTTGNAEQKKAETVSEASRARREPDHLAGAPTCESGKILAALRRSPLVGADLDLSRRRDEETRPS
jgi:hypothetical protein